MFIVVSQHALKYNMFDDVNQGSLLLSVVGSYSLCNLGSPVICRK